VKNSLRYSLVAALVLLGTAGTGLPQHALAAGQVNLSASRTSLVAGEQFTVHLSVAETPGLYGVQLSLAYDAARLKVVAVNAGTAWPVANTFVARKTATPQNVEFAATLFNTSGSVSGDLAAVTFEVLATSAVATTAIGPGASLPFLFADRNGAAIPVGAPTALVVSISPVAAPAPKLTLTSSLPSAAPLAKGDRFAVSLTVSDASTLFGAQFSLGYDSARLKVVELRPGDAWPTGGHFVARNQVTAQTVEFAATLTNHPSGLNGTLATATFEVLGASGSASTSISLASSLPLILADRNGMPIAAAPPAPLTIALAPAPAPTPTPLPTQTPTPTPPAASCVTATIELRAGWNLVILPVVPAAGLSAEGLLKSIKAQGGGATAINRWQSGGWQTHLAGLPFNDFAILAGRALFIKSASASTLTICGTPPAAVSVVILTAGWNLVIIPAGATGHSAESLAKALDPLGGIVSEIAGWSAGSWNSHPRGLPFNNFAVQPGQAYFVRASQALTWTP
jgi:hypothetical protein